MKEKEFLPGCRVRIKKSGAGNVYFRGGNKYYVVQKRSASQDSFFDMFRDWPGHIPKEDYVYLIPDKIPFGEANVKEKLRFINKKYLK